MNVSSVSGFHNYSVVDDNHVDSDSNPTGRGLSFQASNTNEPLPSAKPLTLSEFTKALADWVDEIKIPDVPTLPPFSFGDSVERIALNKAYDERRERRIASRAMITLFQQAENFKGDPEIGCTLDLNQNSKLTTLPACLRQIKNLKRLRIFYCNPSGLAPSILKYCPHLNYLSVNDCYAVPLNLTQKEVDAEIQHKEELRRYELEIRHNYLAGTVLHNEKELQAALEEKRQEDQRRMLAGEIRRNVFPYRFTKVLTGVDQVTDYLNRFIEDRQPAEQPKKAVLSGSGLSMQRHTAEAKKPSLAESQIQAQSEALARPQGSQKSVMHKTPQAPQGSPKSVVNKVPEQFTDEIWV